MNQKRCYGIDALRILGMFFIIILHLLGHGKALSAYDDMQYYGGGYFLCKTLSILAYTGVDIYAIISGYVGYANESLRWKKYITLWGKVFFWSMIIPLFLLAFGIKISRPELLKSLTPLSSNSYWYFSAYTGVFFVAPWINKGLKRLEPIEASGFVAILMIVFSCYGGVIENYNDVFFLRSGYSFIWLTILYTIGAWAKKASFLKNASNRKIFSLIFALYVFVIIVSYAVPTIMQILANKRMGSGLIVSYTSPFIVSISLLMVILFSRIDVQKTGKYLKNISSSTFIIYLIHDNPLIRKYLLSNCLYTLTIANRGLAAFIIILCAVGIFLICLVMDKLSCFIMNNIRRVSVFKAIRSWLGAYVNAQLQVIKNVLAETLKRLDT